MIEQSLYKKYILSLILLALALPATAQLKVGAHIQGIVRDGETYESLPFASIRVDGVNSGAVADNRGIFEVYVPKGTKTITASCVGYKSKKIELRPSQLNLYDISLEPESTELTEVVVKKQKYSKKNNPAVDFVNRLRHLRDSNDPRRNDYYNFDRYERITIGINNFDTVRSRGFVKKMPGLVNHIDTSEISGVPVLNVSMKENFSHVDYRRDPKTEKTTIKASQSMGVDEFMDKENMETILNDILREVNLYDDNITLLRNSFVSPLSPIAPDFYRFYLVGTEQDETGKELTILAFYPRNKASFGFNGHLFVDAADSSMFVKKIDLAAPKDINLNFVKDLKIRQSYDRAPDGSRLKTRDDLIMEFAVLKGLPEVYAARKIAYQNHSFDAPSDMRIFDKLGSDVKDPESEIRDSVYWANLRAIPAQKGETNVADLMTLLRSNPLFFYGEKVLRFLFTGYLPTAKDSKFDFGPINTTASYNSLEGLRVRVGGMTTASLNPHLFARGYVAYGFRDKKVKYSAELEYSFNKKKNHAKEFPIHSITAEQSFDVDRLGAHYLFTNADNFVLSLDRMDDRRFSYRQLSKLTYNLELPNNFSVKASAERLRQQESPEVPFVNSFGEHYRHYDEFAMGLQLRYAPGETYYQTRSNRIPINEENPIFTIAHRYVPKEFLGSQFPVNRTEISIQKKFRMSFLGHLYSEVSGGHSWTPTVFTELFIPNANISYTVQPSSYALMNPMEFINSSYAAWHFEYHARGAFFNLLPGIKKLGLREIVGFHGLWGHLKEQDRPNLNNPNLFFFPKDAGVMTMDKPYMELTAGIDNIFHALRIDYVWRLSYLDVPYQIDRHGLRVALHITF